MMRAVLSRAAFSIALLSLMGVGALAATAQGQDAASVLRPDSATVARRLSDSRPFVRREAAEELARLAATEHRRLVEGYRIQEKDARTRIAFDWALYRMGRNESLFQLVSALNSKNLREQAVGYLKQLETPDPLYIFLDRVNGNTRIRLLEVLASVGDEGTLAKIKPFAQSLDPGIADAAKFAEREITIRIEERPHTDPRRERLVGNTDEEP